MLLLVFRGKTRTFKPRKDVPEGTKQVRFRLRIVSIDYSLYKHSLTSQLVSVEEICRGDTGTQFPPIDPRALML